MIDNVEHVVTSVLALLSAGFLWLIRTVMTNKEQLQLQQQENAQTRAILAEVKESLQGLREEIIEIYKNK